MAPYRHPTSKWLLSCLRPLLLWACSSYNPPATLAGISREALLAQMGPVSYTHLDVYKRQSLVRFWNCGRANAPATRSALCWIWPPRPRGASCPLGRNMTRRWKTSCKATGCGCVPAMRCRSMGR